jgi:hypothetical protein
MKKSPNGYKNEKIYSEKGIKAYSAISEDINFRQMLLGKRLINPIFTS